MGRLVVIEGIDGAGKRTLTNALTQELTRRGKTVTQMAFPRYGKSVHGMAVLFALDRRDATNELRHLLTTHDVVLLDRYISSNAAYGAARLHQDAAGEFVEWVRKLEVDRFRVPVPDAQILLQLPVDIAADRTDQRASLDSSRTKDSNETDLYLQRRCADVYDQLTQTKWLSPWAVMAGPFPRYTPPGETITNWILGT